MGITSLSSFVDFSITAIQAASFRRVTCLDGVNAATNAVCCASFTLCDDLQTHFYVH
ncbi:hypothetical protein M422DRAFT_197116 [Sphaerobolus stellatus SS14]|uniref:Uncharacterized protein n=1 Tax=Sphaerobolus stellatus (strain SS14) TaxID=990650 RepID=A0A0C9UAG1_SPHS4|nr:hypothetical protein M422DRAFT_197116 [Sphaerobolus stellatus SS14]